MASISVPEDGLPRRLGSCSHFQPSRRATCRPEGLRLCRRLPQGGLPFSLRLSRDGITASVSVALARVATDAILDCLGITQCALRVTFCLSHAYRVAPRSVRPGLSSAHRGQRPSCAAGTHLPICLLLQRAYGSVRLRSDPYAHDLFLLVAHIRMLKCPDGARGNAPYV